MVGSERPIRSSVVINVRDFDTVTAFYRDVLKLPVRKSWEAPAGSGMIIDVGPSSTIEFVGPPFAERADRAPVQGVEVMIGVADAAAWLNRLTRAGVTIHRELIENPWGDRSFGVNDPSGRRIWIYEVIGEDLSAT